jgi:hypothetical protein
MIVRAILDNPHLATSFDFFNDYNDTKAWLRIGRAIEPNDARWMVASDALERAKVFYDQRVKDAQ